MERRERAIREERALRYRELCKRKRIAKKKRKAKIKEIIVLTLLWTLLGLALVCKWSGVIISNANAKDHYVYSMKGELQGNCVVLENKLCHEVDETYANYTSKAKSVTVVLDNNGTEEKEDDKILNIY